MPSGMSLGYQQINDLSTAKGLTIPPNTTSAMIIAESQAVRYRDDGTDPTNALGMPLAPGTILVYDSAQFGQLKFIQQVSGAKLNVAYYGG